MDILDRSIFENNKAIQEYCTHTFGEDCQIRYCNFGFVVVPPRSPKCVYKYYIRGTHYARIESATYSIFYRHGIVVPTYTPGEVYAIGDWEFDRASIENIRIYGPRRTSFSEFDIQKLASVISQIHAIESSHIHGNIHPSNFYTLPSGEIGVFDLSTYAPGPREKDIARVFMHSGYDEVFLSQFLSFYDFEISLKKVYLLALIETRELHVTQRSDGYLGEIHTIINRTKS